MSKSRLLLNCKFCLRANSKFSYESAGSSRTQSRFDYESVDYSSTLRAKSFWSPKFSGEDSKLLLEVSNGKHPGSMSLPALHLPNAISDSINDMLFAQKGMLGVIKKEATRLEAFLRSRTPPYVAVSERKFNKKQWKSAMMERLAEGELALSPEQTELFESELEEEAERRRRELKQLASFWKAISYDSHNACLAYALCRAAPNYAVSVRVLNEIFKRDAHFLPDTVLDFGSGCGSFMWALQTLWPQKTSFYYLNDVSSNFNELSCSILAGDDVDFNPVANGIYYKLHLPADVSPNFDLIYSGYTLSEMDGPGSRLAAIKHLLKCTRRYIVFVEDGTLRSHHLMEEIREYVALNMADQFEIFAPCAHMKPCPLLMLNLRGNLKSLICRTPVTYFPFPIRNHTEQNAKTELFTYVIFRRKSDPAPTEVKSECSDLVYPRIVQPVKRQGKHVVLRLCCADGSAVQTAITKAKHPWYFYRSCKLSVLGDRLPVSGFLEEEEEEEADVENDLLTSAEEEEMSEHDLLTSAVVDSKTDDDDDDPKNV